MNTYTLVQFGAYNMSNNKCFVTSAPGFMDTNNTVQRIANSRFAGSSIVNSRIAERSVKLTGKVCGDTIEMYDTNVKEFKKNMYKDGVLRFAKKWESVLELDSDDNWDVSGTTVSKSFDSSNYVFGSGSIQFDSTGSGSCGITASELGGTDLSDYSGLGNFEMWLYIPDRTGLSSVELSLADNSGGIVTFQYTSQISGDNFVNGWNYLSTKWSNGVVTGSIDPSNIGYNISLTVNATASYDNWRLGGVIWNYDEYTYNLDGRFETIALDANHYNSTFTKFTANFVNASGVAENTNYVNAYLENGVTDTTKDITLDLDGTYEPEPTITITLNDATDLGSIQLNNNTNNTSVTIDQAFASGDIIVIDSHNKDIYQNNTRIDYTDVLPVFELGENDLSVSLVSTGEETISQLTLDSDLGGEI